MIPEPTYDPETEADAFDRWAETTFPTIPNEEEDRPPVICFASIWASTLAGLLEGLDRSDSDDRAALRLRVEQATKTITVDGMRRIAREVFDVSLPTFRTRWDGAVRLAELAAETMTTTALRQVPDDLSLLCAAFGVAAERVGGWGPGGHPMVVFRGRQAAVEALLRYSWGEEAPR